MEDVDLLVQGEPVDRLSGAHRPIVERDEPAAAGLGPETGCARPAVPDRLMWASHGFPRLERRCLAMPVMPVIGSSPISSKISPRPVESGDGGLGTDTQMSSKFG